MFVQGQSALRGKRMDRETKAAGPPPDANMLHEAALAYLARYAATEASLRRVLDRRIDRWARQAGGEDPDRVAQQAATARQEARSIVARLAAAGAVNDAAYAESKARSLLRAGRSRRAIGAHLAAKGVGAEMQRQVLSDDAASELAAALVLARRRHIGPFRNTAPPDAAGRRRELALLARAGFPQDIARRVLDADAEEAETLVNQLRR
jgi:regulatory protein